jgi:polysaccharide export outer membrane protein
MAGTCPVAVSGQVRVTPPDYRIRAGDQVFISAPQRPALNRRVTVDPEGNVDLPVVGKVPAQGFTVSEFQAQVSRAIQEIYPSITEVSVTIEEVAGQSIYVTGMVGRPGKYDFPGPTNLWEAIREAGGPRPGAVLNGVQVVADESRGGKTTLVNVQEALERGSVDRLPDLEDGDTVIIPREEERYTGSDGVSVIGAVNNPGVYRLGGRQDLMSAVLSAGGPTRRAKLSEVRVIRVREDGAHVTETINLQRYLDTGDGTANPIMKPGYTVSVPEQNAVSYQFKNNAGLALGIVTSVLSIAWLVIRIQDRQ